MRNYYLLSPYSSRKKKVLRAKTFLKINSAVEFKQFRIEFKQKKLTNTASSVPFCSRLQIMGLKKFICNVMNKVT